MDKEDLVEDPADHSADRGDNDDNESFDNDDDNDDVKKDEEDEKTDDSTSTPPTFLHHIILFSETKSRTAQVVVRSHTLRSPLAEACITEFVAALSSSSLPPSVPPPANIKSLKNNIEASDTITTVNQGMSGKDIEWVTLASMLFLSDLIFSSGGTDGGSDDEDSAATNSVMHASASGDRGRGGWCRSRIISLKCLSILSLSIATGSARARCSTFLSSSSFLTSSLSSSLSDDSLSSLSPLSIGWSAGSSTSDNPMNPLSRTVNHLEGERECYEIDLFGGDAPVQGSNTTLRNHITHLHCEVIKAQKNQNSEARQTSMARDGSVFRYDADYLREQFAGLVIQRELPFNHFNHEKTTRVFQNTMQQRYTHVNRSTLKRDAMKLWLVAKQEIIDSFGNINDFVNQTMDVWSVPHGVPGSYMCVTAHWIEPDTWQMMKWVISFEEFPSPHRGHALFKMLIKVLTNFNLED
nr:hypothetical protein [Tanacetum cinerariifolium]